MHVACATDERYLPHAATMLQSLLSNQTTDVHVHLLHGPEMTTGPLEAMAEMVRGAGAEVSAWQVRDDWVAGLPTVGRIPKAMWYRIFLPQFLAGVRKVLYLDADVLVCERLDDLWHTNLDGALVAAVTNVPEAHHLRRAAELGLRSARDYFNSGVLLLNLELMRARRSTRELLELAVARRDELLWPDQDALNLVLGEARVPLHPRWNRMNSFRFPWSGELLGYEELEQALAHPAIVHFEGPGPNKPWHFLAEGPVRELYSRHRARTPWANWRPEGASLANRVRGMWRRGRDRVG